MSKSPLKRSGSKQQESAVQDTARHASKKRKLAGELKKESRRSPAVDKPSSSPIAKGAIIQELQTPNKDSKSPAADTVHEDGDIEKKRRKSKTKSKSKGEGRVKWNITPGIGGKFLASDPIFSGDEKHLILATRSAVHVYSTSTSLLVRSLEPDTDSNITTYALSPTNADILYVGTFAGHISKWDWTTGELQSEFAGPSDLLTLLPAPLEEAVPQREFLYAIHCSGDKQKSVSFLRMGESETQIQTLMERRFLARNMYLSSDGKVLILNAGQKLIFGAVHLLAKAKGESKIPTFREVTLPEDIYSIDVRERKKSASTKPQDPALDIVIGTRRGPILLYDDVYGKLLAKERQKEGNLPGDIIPRRLHWHRDLVNSVKWSRDGNYVISGGKETVIVIWQLDTSQRQYLPHLSAEILNITVSPAGTSYALQLSNNTSIVLATSELAPTASMSGLHIPDPLLGKDKSLRKPSRSVAAVNTRRPDEILLVASSMLQTFDTRTLQTVSRQALTRNHITNVNVTPSGHMVKDPTITHMVLSHDGMWLATVDEWCPLVDDLDPLYPRQSTTDDRREVYLKFWTYDSTDKLWQLNTRVDRPHSEEKSASGTIHALHFNPARLEFATIGDDGNVKIWSPQRRTRDGQPVRDKNGRDLLDWSCRYTVHINTVAYSSVPEAALAFSEDGSVLAAHALAQNDGLHADIRLIDNVKGTIQSTVPLTSSITVARMAFLGPYLIVVNTHLSVLDLVRQSLIYSIPISSTTRNATPIADGFLTTNPLSQTFAVSFPLDSKHGHIPQFQLSVFSPEQVRPIYTSVTDYTITSILSDKTKGGFVIIDEDAVIHRIQPSSSSNAPASTSLALPEPKMKLGLADMFGSSLPKITGAPTGTSTADAAVQEQLALKDTQQEGSHGALSAIFRTQRPTEAGVTPVSVLFDQVAQKLLRKKVDGNEMEE